MLFTASVQAAPPARMPPPTVRLSEKEQAEGWVELFDGVSLFGLDVVSGTPLVQNGELHLPAGAIVEFRPGFPKPEFLAEPNTLSLEIDQVRGVATLRGSTTNAVILKSLKARPKEMKPIFNGKDLSGWKPYTGDPKKEKSSFAVTPEGELSLKSGPGDLQTTESYADFVLQLECKTLAKSLNSGVFFRGIPGQYQQGYEAQIQNTIVNGDRAKPLDFGTGAIYRRMAARAVMADDNQWFCMTVSADGPKFRTWVNGVPVLAWTDDRPVAENGRNGRKTSAGVISLQGHDPTTDLLFRNLRLSAKAAGK
ncbi:MAG: 3-keto-disaccharide hydrolase [Gemmataceae bacterium]